MTALPERRTSGHPAISGDGLWLSTILFRDERLGNGPAPFVSSFDASVAALAQSYPAALLPLED